MNIEKLRHDAGKRVANFQIVDIETGTAVPNQVNLADGVDFLFNFLLPAHREIGQRAKGRTVIIWAGLPIVFEKSLMIGGERQQWKMTIGKQMDEETRGKVRGRILAAFSLWGARKIEATWNETERGGIVLYLDCEVTGFIYCAISQTDGR